MTYALRQQFQDMDRSVQSDERQKLADLAATQLRRRTAELERIGQQTPQQNWDLPEGATFGAQNAGAPAGSIGTPTGGGAAYKPRAGVRPTPTPTGPDQSTAETARLARQSTDGDAFSRLRAAGFDASRTSPADRVAGARFSRAQSAGQPTNNLTQSARFERLLKLNPATEAPRAEGPGYASPQEYSLSGASGKPSPLSVRNNNPGNLKFAGQAGATPDARGFAVFQSPEAGAAAADRQLALYMQRDGLNTVQGIVSKWSPVSDPGNATGSTANYARYVAQQLGVSPDQPLSPQDIPRLRQAMAQFEAGTTSAVSGQPQQSAAPQAPGATYSGMSPGGSPQMIQEQVQMAKFQYDQLAQMLPYLPPDQQMEAQAKMQTLATGAQMKQALMFAQMSDANPQALGRLVTLSGAQVARTQDGRYVMVDQAGKPVSQPVTGGQLGAFLYRAMDERAQASQAEMQGKIALEQAKAQAQAQGKLMEQGGTAMDMERFKKMMDFYIEQNKPGENRAIADPMGGGIRFYSSRGDLPTDQPNAVTIR